MWTKQKGCASGEASGRRPWHSKALHCYALLSIWILLIIAGVYNFVQPLRDAPTSAATTDLFRSLEVDVRTRRIFRVCNLPEEIDAGSEGNLDRSRWSLKGLLILIRHGDRGPLQHVKNISYINCGGWNDEHIRSYQEFFKNVTTNGKTSWIGTGPFHGFPILPTHPNRCQLGQLTMQGVSQLLRLGEVLRQSYAPVWPKLLNLTQHELAIFSTRYRRTFQSALAFLYGLVSPETLSKVTVKESQSMSFCFQDCACPVSERYDKYLKLYLTQQLVSHPAVSLLAESTGRAIFSIGAEQGFMKNDPHAVRDALLTYICHNSGLPCENPANCIKRQNVAGIFAYTDWVNHQKWGNVNWKRFCLLKSYGLIKHIVSQMLRMVSNSGPYLILYSGHDHTLGQLISALGIQAEPLFLKYAGRIVFEVYHDNGESPNGVRDVYFRVLINGKDVTHQVAFCKDVIPEENLCKIEDIVRFTHDDYFSNLNYTNFKDACSIKPL